MKKNLLAILILLSTITFAQDFSNTRFGVTAGLNYSRVRHVHNPSGPRYSFQAGGLALIPISNDDQFYLQPEVVYYGAGESGKDKDAKGVKGYDAVYANNYISVPLYFKGYFSEAESEFFAMVGPRFNFLINQNVENAAEPGYTIDGDPNIPNFNGKASSFNFALGFGLGFSFKRQLEIVGKYDWGFSNTYKGLMFEDGNDGNIGKNKTEHVLSIGLNYIFD